VTVEFERIWKDVKATGITDLIEVCRNIPQFTETSPPVSVPRIRAGTS
jgi:hypothetical protein